MTFKNDFSRLLKAKLKKTLKMQEKLKKHTKVLSSKQQRQKMFVQKRNVLTCKIFLSSKSVPFDCLLKRQ